MFIGKLQYYYCGFAPSPTWFGPVYISFSLVLFCNGLFILHGSLFSAKEPLSIKKIARFFDSFVLCNKFLLMIYHI